MPENSPPDLGLFGRIRVDKEEFEPTPEEIANRRRRNLDPQQTTFDLLHEKRLEP
jgi:hypothetical protein